MEFFHNVGAPSAPLAPSVRGQGGQAPPPRPLLPAPLKPPLKSSWIFTPISQRILVLVISFAQMTNFLPEIV